MSRKEFIQDFEKAKKGYPYLVHKPTAKEFFNIEGELAVFDEKGVLWDIYSIKITFTELYPRGFGKLYETGNMIKACADWHKDSSNVCCICSEPEELIQRNKNFRINSFIKEYAVPFLANTTYRKEFGKYPNGSYSHGNAGIFEWYFEQFPHLSIQKTIDILLDFKNSSKKIKRQNPCPCGSGKKFKSCCRKSYENIRLIPKDRFFSHIKLLEMKYKSPFSHYEEHR